VRAAEPYVKETRAVDRTAGDRVDRSAGEDFLRDVRDSIWRAVVVDEHVIRLLAVALLARGHVLVEDVPGVGKTLLTRAFSQTLGLTFARVQGTPDLLPSDVLGASILQDGRFRFIPGPVFANILLVDEINRTTPRTQSALLEAMEEGRVSIEGETRPLPDPFLVLATQNPIELEGTFSLPEAQLDRFLVRVRLGYPHRDDEARIARRYQARSEPLDAVDPIVPADGIVRLREAVRTVEVSAPVEAYIVDIVRATRDRPDVRLGGSPRATVALYRGTQAWAFLAGRDFALPDDVKALVPAVMGHRILLDFDRQLGGATSDDVIGSILGAVPAPPAAPAKGERED
jgi:MoxR-like ATPase